MCVVYFYSGTAEVPQAAVKAAVDVRPRSAIAVFGDRGGRLGLFARIKSDFLAARSVVCFVHIVSSIHQANRQIRYRTVLT